MKTFYVSLTKDLIGCYLAITAESEMAVRQYLFREYTTPAGEWKLPWCAVYDTEPTDQYGPTVIITAPCGTIYEERRSA